MSTAPNTSPTAQNTPVTPSRQGQGEKAAKIDPPCVSQDMFRSKLPLAGQATAAQATFILGVDASARAAEGGEGDVGVRSGEPQLLILFPRRGILSGFLHF